MRRVLAMFAPLAIAVVVAAGCGGGNDRLTVLAAASLRDVFTSIDARPEYAFGGSGVLARQVLEGVRADVIATAGAGPMDTLVEAGAVEEPVVFATSRLVIVVERGNPAGVASLGDLGRSGLVVVLAEAGVPAGDYARQALEAAGAERVLEEVASFEDDVRGVLAKVVLGEADAGVVYATDVRAGGDDVEAVEVPDRYQPGIEYLAAVVADAPQADAARAFVAALEGERARGTLAEAGFGTAP